MKTWRALRASRVVTSASVEGVAGDEAAGENPGSLDAFERMFSAQ